MGVINALLLVVCVSKNADLANRNIPPVDDVSKDGKLDVDRISATTVEFVFLTGDVFLRRSDGT